MIKKRNDGQECDQWKKGIERDRRRNKVNILIRKKVGKKTRRIMKWKGDVWNVRRNLNHWTRLLNI